MQTEIIGPCTLYRADWTEVRDLLPMDAAVVTDPPYGIGYRAPTGIGGDNRELKRRSYAPIYGDDKPFDPSPWLAFPEVILWGANHYAHLLPPSAAWMVWDKRDGMRSNDNSDCEMAWRKSGGSARLFRHLWNGMCQASEKGVKRVHPTQKPVAVMEWCLGFVKAQTILDPYMGSGSTGIASIRARRAFVGVEIEQAYFDAACRRIELEAKKVEALLC